MRLPVVSKRDLFYQYHLFERPYSCLNTLAFTIDAQGGAIIFIFFTPLLNRLRWRQPLFHLTLNTLHRTVANSDTE